MATLVSLTTHGFLLNGRAVEEGPLQPVHSPYTGEVFAQVVRGTRAQAEEAIAGAVQAFELTRKLPAYERQRILNQVSDQIAFKAEDFAHTMAMESGKPIRTARAEVARAIFTFAVGRRGGYPDLR
jgi:acyl-CoA reductase-like NAD-dependent aldehyde dehydrogenase